jgi:hypothetical protein
VDTERRCTCQHGHHDNNDYYYYNNNNDNVDYNHDGCTNDNIFFNNIYNFDYVNFDYVNFHNNARTTRNHRSVNINYCATTYYNDVHNNHTSAHCYSVTHRQRIRQQFICVKRCTKTATQQTWCSIAIWRFGVVCGVSRVQCPQSPQPAHGQTFAIGVHLSFNPCSGAAGHPERAVCGLGSGANLHR